MEEVLGELQSIGGSVLGDPSRTLESRGMLPTVPVGGVSFDAVSPEEKAVDNQHQSPLLAHGELNQGCCI